MAWIPKAQIEFANDLITASLVLDEGSGTRVAIQQIASALISAAVAADPTLASAVISAIDARVTAEDLIQGTDPRVPKLGNPKRFLVDDKDGREALFVDPNGKTTAQDFIAAFALIAGMEILPGTGWGVRGKNGRSPIYIDPATGRVTIRDLHPDTGRPAARVIVQLLIGQSNMNQTAAPVSSRLDVIHPRIMSAQWDPAVTWPAASTVTAIVPATTPMSAQKVRSGISPGMFLAREIVREMEDTIVVVLDGSVSGSGLLTDTDNGVWGVDYTGANPKLFPRVLAALNATLRLVRSMYPGVPVDVWGAFHQGEADGGQTLAAYSTALDALLTGFRTGIGRPTMPFVLGGTVPEATPALEYANITAAHIGTPARLPYTAFVPGVKNGGGSGSVTDTVHYHREGAEVLGKRMHKGIKRAIFNTATTVPHPPLTVSATWRKSAGALTISWDFPECRVSNFVVQYSIDDGAWVTVTGRTIPLDTTATVTGLNTGSSIAVRIATVAELGTSAYTTPVYATLI